VHILIWFEPVAVAFRGILVLNDQETIVGIDHSTSEKRDGVSR